MVVVWYDYTTPPPCGGDGIVIPLYDYTTTMSYYCSNTVVVVGYDYTAR